MDDDKTVVDQDEALVTEALANENQTDGPDPDDELEDYEVEAGKVKKIPKWAKPRLMMEKDYRQKTQEVAAARKAFDDERKAFGETKATQQKFISDVASYRAVEADLAEYAKVDWNAYRDQDKDAAERAWFQFQQLKDRRGTMAKTINAKIARDRQEETAYQEKMKSEFEREAAVKIKGWSPEKRAEINKVLMEEYGFTEQDVAENYDVRSMRLAADAAWLRSIREKAKQKNEAPIARPVTQLTGAAAASQAVSDKDSVAAWMAKRNAQDARRRKGLN